MEKEEPNEPFWTRVPLQEMTPTQWESLCDGCGKCCLFKVEDPTTQQIRTTKVACRLLDTRTGRCSNYKERFRYVDDCIKLTASNLQTITWLPKTCAYRLVKEKKPLPDWHPLRTGDPQSARKQGHSACGFAIPSVLARRPLLDYLLEEEIS